MTRSQGYLLLLGPEMARTFLSWPGCSPVDTGGVSDAKGLESPSRHPPQHVHRKLQGTLLIWP